MYIFVCVLISTVLLFLYLTTCTYWSYSVNGLGMRLHTHLRPICIIQMTFISQNGK